MNVQQHGNNNQRNSNVYYSRNCSEPTTLLHPSEATPSRIAEKLELSAPASPRRCVSPRRRKQTETSRRGKRISSGGGSVDKIHVLNTIPMVFAADKKDDMESPQRLACDPPGMLSNDLSSFLHKDAEKTKKRASKKRSKPKPSDNATVVTWIRCSDSVASKDKNSTNPRRIRTKREDLQEPAIVLPNESRRGMLSRKQQTADDVLDHTSYTTTSSSSRRSDETPQEKLNIRRKSKLKPTKKKSSSSRRNNNNNNNKSSSSLNSGGKREKTKRIAMDAAAAANTLFRPAYSDNRSSVGVEGGEEYFQVSPRKAAFANAISESSSKRREASISDGNNSTSSRKLSMIAAAKSNSRRVSLKGNVLETPRSKKRTSVVATNPHHACISSALPLDFSDFENDDFSVHNNAADDDGRENQQQNSFAVSIDGVVQW